MSQPILNAPAAVEAVIHGLTHPDYVAAPGLSNSAMKRLHPTPAHYLAPDDDEEDATADQVLGTMCHTLVLDPESPLPGVAIMGEEINLRTKAGREWREGQRAAGLVPMRKDKHEAAVGMARAVCRQRLANHLLRRGHSEVSYFRTVQTEWGRVVLKARVDFVPEGSDLLVDLKTTALATKSAFADVVSSKRYYTQAAHYLAMHNALRPDDVRNEMIFFVVERRPPHLVACYRLGGRFMARAALDLADDLASFARCTAQGVFPGYPEGPETVDPPLWFAREDPRS